MRDVKIGSNVFCGPAVLSILTGKTTDECASVFTRVTGRYDIKAVNTEEILKALDALRFEYSVINAGCSLFTLLHQIHDKDGMYIVVVPKHVVAVEVKDEKIYLCDNHTKSPITVSSSARLGQTVLVCYKTQAKPDPILESEKIHYVHIKGKIIFSKVKSYTNGESSKIELGTITYDNRKEFQTICDLMQIIHNNSETD